MTASLSAPQRTLLERFVQRTRILIEDDLASTLEGRFGIHESGDIEGIESLSLSNAQLARRAELLDVLTYLRSEGADARSAVERLVREAAFTHTNRLIAVRIAEAIGLLGESMAKGLASSGFKDFSELAPIVADTDWGRFAMFVRLCADELAPDIPALFDPRNPLLGLAMSEPVLANVVGSMLEIPADIWAAPDALGWAYQFFNTGDERRKMRDASAAPRNSRELAVRNQFFTPSYVVEFLVQNGLGAHLVSGFPELADDLPLLVEVPAQRTEVSLDEVSVLDPACGSGHFLLGSYDVLERAWQLAGSTPEEAAPAIVRSLWGIDIDARATQIAQAAIVFRARRHCGTGPLPTPNVICARALPSGAHVDALVDGLPEQVSRAVKAVAAELSQAPLLGPLLKVEERLSHEVRDVLGTGKVRGTLAEYSGVDGSMRQAVMRALGDLADSTTSSVVQRLFVSEVSDAVRFVEAMSRRYTAVLMNPPFGQGCAEAEGYLRAAYPDSWTELYACFVQRGLELSTGSVGAITSSTFLAARRLRDMRSLLVGRGLAALIDLGGGVLHGATVSTAAFVVRQSTSTRYLDATRSEDKDAAVRSAVPAGFRGHDLGRFRDLPNEPFAFHVSEPTLALWAAGSTLDPATATVRTGGKTFDNFRYVRLWWELPHDSVERGWRWYEKGGEYQPYSSPTRLLVNWKDEGAELRQYGATTGRTAQVLQSSKFWGLPGLCFPRMSSIGFSARVMPEGEVFADTSIAVLPHEQNARLAILAYLNSTPVAEVLSVFGRGRSTENASVKSLPFSSDWASDVQLANLAGSLIRCFAEAERWRETSPSFRVDRSAPTDSIVAKNADEVERLQTAVDDRVAALMGLSARVDSTTTKRPALNRKTLEGLAPEFDSHSLLSLAVGQAFGRWIGGTDHGDDSEDWFRAAGMPSHVASPDVALPLLVDEPGHDLDIALRVRLAFTELAKRFDWRVEAPDDLARYIRTRFFAQHLLDYSASARSAPIYWQLQVPSRTWGVWIYAPSFSREVLFAVVSEAERRRILAEQQVAYLRSDTGAAGRSASTLAREIQTEERLSVELATFRVEVERIANLGWEPDLDDGIILNVAPLASVFPAWKDAAAARHALRTGAYEWATVARFADRL